MKITRTGLFCTVLALPISWSCSPSRPVAEVPKVAPALPSDQPAEPVTDGRMEDLQQQLAGTLAPSFDFPEVEGFARSEINQFDDSRLGYSFAYDSTEPKI